MKDHEKANFINELTEIARTYGHTQQLRERISYCVHVHVPKESNDSDVYLSVIDKQQEGIYEQ